MKSKYLFAETRKLLFCNTNNDFWRNRFTIAFVMNTTGEELTQGPERVYILTTAAKYELLESARICKTYSYNCLYVNREGMWGSAIMASLIINPGIRCKWVVSFNPRPLTAGERDPVTRWMWGWVGPRVDIETVPRFRCCQACSLVTILQNVTNAIYS